MKKVIKSLISLVLCLAITFTCQIFADKIQRDFGNIDVTLNSFELNYKDFDGNTKTGNVTYKLYVPKTASKDNKASALLMLHGYQNDHETDDAYCIELARRGMVVMAIDEFGHGSTDISMINRGYVNHKVSVNYGNDSQEDGTFSVISGQNRYKVLMNFSNLSFFNDKYSKDEQGQSILDSSMGGVGAYLLLSEMEMVDNTKMVVSGHSMGTWASWSVSAAYANSPIKPKATILQAGELFTKDAYDSEKITFNNVLLLTSKYDEFNYFRDYSKATVNDDVVKNDITSEFLNVDKGTGKWNTTYGSFSDGSARRRQLLITNHRLATHDHKALATAIDWIDNAVGLNTSISSDNHTYAIKDLLGLVATFAAIASMIALMNILLETKLFNYLKQPQLVAARVSRIGTKYWKGAIITMLIATFTYPFMTQLGHGLLPLNENIFRMTIGNGFVAWYGLLIIIMLLTTLIPYLKAKKKGDKSILNMGLTTKEKSNNIDFKSLGLSLLLAVIMVGFMYLQCIICEKVFLLDFRYIWPFFKGFTADRVVQFLVYIPLFLLFFLLNNSKIFAQNQPEGSAEPGFKGFVKCWYKNALCMVGGILIIILIEYIPFFASIGPGVDLLFSSTFGGPFMSLMIVFVPQVLIFSIICTYIYRKTGTVYTGAFVVAMLACWIVTGGSAML